MLEGNRLSFPSFVAEKLAESGYHCVVTGGGGWIGQAVLEMLDGALGQQVSERVSVFGSSERTIHLRSGREIACRTLEHLKETSDAPILFIHCAFLTKDRLQSVSATEFVAANRAIAGRVVAAIEHSDARGIFVPSSGAVYKRGTHVPEDDLAANPYGMMKLEDEDRFGALAAQRQIPLCQPRLFNLSGPFINKHELYALASMINKALAGAPITIFSPPRVVRSYVHVADLVTLAFAMLLAPEEENPAVFDTAGDEALELGDLAALVRETLDRPDLPIERADTAEKQNDVYAGDGREMARIMRRYRLNPKSMSQQIWDTAAYLSDVK
ncbi:MAG: NAD-dependent epimerase/dehydratase family protein [Pseudomonadota bacterium]